MPMKVEPRSLRCDNPCAACGRVFKAGLETGPKQTGARCQCHLSGRTAGLSLCVHSSVQTGTRPSLSPLSAHQWLSHGLKQEVVFPDQEVDSPKANTLGLSCREKKKEKWNETKSTKGGCVMAEAQQRAPADKKCHREFAWNQQHSAL